MSAEMAKYWSQGRVGISSGKLAPQHPQRYGLQGQGKEDLQFLEVR